MSIRRGVNQSSQFNGIGLLLVSLFCVSPLATYAAESTALPTTAPTKGDYVGRQVCQQCHQEQHQQWLGSHHDLAMQEANEQTVLGNFDNAQFNYFGQTSKFFKRDGRFMVNTDGPDGALQDYEIVYTFGVYPLQQYLIALSGGRLQAFGVAWDSRPQDQGGQRWFHVYPNEPVKHDDRLHWTSPDQNWNYMCAECHSTDLNKNYDATTDSYQTTWQEIDVSCEACHGPASQHVTWAQQQEQNQQSTDRKTNANKGLLVSLNERVGAQWIMNPETGNAERKPAKQSHHEIEMCARCHSRRGVIAQDYVHGKPLLDTHLLQLLTEGMYYSDGQIQEEVYVYGSFLQSKMYQAGVTCSDCHEPHSLSLRASGNTVCLQCHRADKFDTVAHHFHPVDSKGSSCAKCHMPPTNYMVVDPRHDHSMRVPRPDLSVKFGTPNACNQCHTDKTSEWAAAQVKTWYGETPNAYQNYAEALHAGRTRKADAESLLRNLADSDTQPAIARATALAALRDYLSPTSIGVVQQGLGGINPLLRLGAIEALQPVPLQARWQLASILLKDPILAVRIAAGRSLAAVPINELPDAQQSALRNAIADYISAQRTNADRPEAWVNLGGLYGDLSDMEKAESAYRNAIKLQPGFMPAYVNLADFYRSHGNDAEGEKVLRQALIIEQQNADVLHALGLLLVRDQRNEEALTALAEAARLSPENPRYSYVHAVALQSGGDLQQAIKVLEEAHQRFPGDREILYALTTFHRDGGNLFAARLYAGKLLALSPQDPAAQQLLHQLQLQQ